MSTSESAVTLPPADHRPNGLAALGYFLLYFLLSFGVSVIAATLHSLLAGSGAIGDFSPTFLAVTAFASSTVAYLVIFVISGDYRAALMRRIAALGLANRILNRQVGAAILLGAFFSLLVIGYMMVFPPPPEAEQITIAQIFEGGLLAITLGLLLVLVIAPVCEEYLFRGLILDGFGKSLGTLTGILLSSLLFAIAHLGDYYIYWPAMAAVLLLGLINALWRIKTDNLATAVGSHFAYNLVMLTFAFV